MTTMQGISFSAVVHAEESDPFDSSSVLDDLSSSTIDGLPFNIDDYTLDKSKDVQLITLVEYCYGYNDDMCSRYGLYVYVYNPSGKKLAMRSSANKIQMATHYGDDGSPDKYDKFPLVFCSKSTGALDGILLKFKLQGVKSLLPRLNPQSRRYDISGIELLTYPNSNAIDYTVGGTYIFTGFASGYGENAHSPSTLSCITRNFETLQLNVHHTYYRTNVSSLGKNHYNEVNTVYFSVPNNIFEKYGYLQKIHAEWWEYKTKMAAITSNESFYKTLLQYVGTDVGTYTKSIPLQLYADYVGSVSTTIGRPTIHNYGWSYNVDLSTKRSILGMVTEKSNSRYVANILPYAFYSPVVGLDSIFDFFYSNPIAGSVSSNKITEWIYNYSNDLGHGYIDCNGKELSKDLFESFVDPERTMGYNNKTIDLSETFNLKSYDTNHSWWDKLWDYGLSWPKTNESYYNVSPILILDSASLSGSDSDISKRLLINKADVKTMKSFYTNATNDNCSVVLFRFANTDYYCAPAFRTGLKTSIENTDTYVAQETIFLDFDIIELTFNSKEGSFVMATVSSPIDIINEFTPPPRTLNRWKIILAIIILILLLLLLLPVLPYLVKAFISLFLLPVKIIKRSKGKRKEKVKPKEKDSQ